MKLAELKSEFHTLIDQVNDPEILTQFYDAFTRSINSSGSLWQSLSEQQQKEVLLAYEESEDENNLISFSSLKAKYKEWPLR